MNDKFSGRFIVLDGPDGCGKSTQTDRLCRWLEGQGASAATFRDPGATAVGEKIRKILLDPVHESMGADVEVLLYMAARAQLWKEKIAPALERGECVVMDRWISSTCAYQGCAGGFGVEKVIRLGGDCLERVWPDITIILDVDPDTAKGRMDRELDRMEQKGADYHRRVREGFLELAETVDRVVKVDAADSIEAVHENIVSIVAGLIGSEGRK